MEEASKIFRKQGVTDYQQKVNSATEKLCVETPSLIRNRGVLLKRARQSVHESGYLYAKGKSRSKDLGTIKTTPNVDRACRLRRLKELEDIDSFNKRIMIKEERCKSALAVKNYKLCEQVQEELSYLKQQKKERKRLNVERLNEKGKKHKWYQKMGSQASETDRTSDDQASSSSITPRSWSHTPKRPPLFVSVKNSDQSSSLAASCDESVCNPNSDQYF